MLPLVASTIVVRPGSIRPSASAASIIATPILSLTLPPGLYDSSFANSRAPLPGRGRASSASGSSTIGVPPTSSAMLIGIPARSRPTIVQPAPALGQALLIRKCGPIPAISNSSPSDPQPAHS